MGHKQMLLTESFGVRLTPTDRRSLERLAEHEQRTAADTLRRLIRSAAQGLAEEARQEFSP